MSRVVLAMSGGVDSSVAAHLLLEQGHELIGVFMRHGEEAIQACSVDGSRERSPILPLYESPKTHKQGCCGASDAEDARRVADQLNIPFYALNLREEFQRIIRYFVEEYSVGRTPNPCVACNNWIKFGKLFEYADSIGAEFVATGHYARLTSTDDGDLALRRGVDDGKDQSYVLFGIARDRLRRMLLPVGDYRKARIREIANTLGLRVADKRDSQEICFVAHGEHDEFVRARRGDLNTSGDLVTTDGRVVGRHPGIERFTIGQRRGLGVALGERTFVIRIEPRTCRVVLGSYEELGRRELTANDWNWLLAPRPGSFRCGAKIRYNSPPAPATAESLPAGRVRVLFDEPRHGVAPGQAVVCYDGDRVLGGGWIE